MKRTLKIALLVVVAIVLVGYLIPERKAMPVGGPGDYNHQSFRYWSRFGNNTFAALGIVFILEILLLQERTLYHIWNVPNRTGVQNPQ